LAVAAACSAPAGQRAAPDVDQPGAKPGVVLHEAHAQSPSENVDTLITYVTAEHVRVSHPGGASILDLGAGRLYLLDLETSSYRDVSLEVWESRIQEALVRMGEGTNQAEGAPRFEPQGGEADILGFPCQRFVLFGRRQMLGQEELVEQQIWMTQGIEMPAGAYDAYQKALRAVQSIGFTGVAERPPGVVLRAETRVRLANSNRRAPASIERSTIFLVQRISLADSLFSIPDGFSRAAEE
jgi:hypothetical protein